MAPSRRIGGVLLCILAFLFVFGAMPAAAKPAVDPLTVNRSATGQAYIDEVTPKGVDADATYARSVTGDLSEGYTPDLPKKEQRSSNRSSRPLFGDGMGMIFVIGGLVVLLIAIVLFGGGGMLLSRDPTDMAGKPKADGWKTALGADGRLPNDVLAQIAAMADRREAMVQLLRYSLQYAASKTDVRFARSDTEREALRRLPKSWARLNALRALLRETELAHYGGRPVSEDSFQYALRTAAEIMERAVPQGATHA